MREFLRKLIPRRAEPLKGVEPVLERRKVRLINPVAEPDRARLEAFRIPGVVRELKGPWEQGLRGSGPIETEKK